MTSSKYLSLTYSSRRHDDVTISMHRPDSRPAAASDGSSDTTN